MDPRSDGAENVKLVGYDDLQGRQALQVTTNPSNEENHRLYIGFRGAGPMGSRDIADPTNPKLVWSYDVSPPVDRVGTGLFVLEHTGKKPTAATKTNERAKP